MKLLYMLGAGGVEYWRGHVPAAALQKHGLAETRVLDRRHYNATEIGEALDWCEAVVIPSPASTTSLAGLMKYQTLGKKVFVDYDDFPFECSPYNPAYKTLGLEEVYVEDPATGEKTQLWKDGHEGFDIKQNYFRLRALKDILHIADLVTTTTPYLRDRWAQMVDFDKIRVCPNGVDFERWKPLPGIRDKYEPGFRLGYICSASHAEDWIAVNTAIHYFLDKHPDATFVVMGDVGFDLQGRFKPGQLEWHPWSDLREGHYQYKAASLGLDVAICPLAVNEFNRCKSPLKYVEMTAFGYPVIAQKMLPYTADIVHGENGLLAGSTEEWLGALEGLYLNKDLRAKLHFNATLTCRYLYDVKRTARDWARAYGEVLGQPSLILA
jgi:glycosyltransferase involved in cell wall biosynthesis